MFLFRGIASIASSVRNVFVDNFNRSDAGDLGEATDGSRWTALRGVFTVFGNKAKTTSLPSNYPIASIDMPDSPNDQDVVISLKGTTPGTGAALWISDSGNWWAVTTGIEVGENCQCQTCTNCTAGNCTAGNCSVNGNCIPGNCNVNGPCIPNPPVNFTNPVTYNTIVPWSYRNAPNNPTGGNVANYNCNAWNFGNCNTTNSPCVFWSTSGGTCRVWRSINPRYCNAWNFRSQPCTGYGCSVTGNRFCRSSSPNFNPVNPGTNNPFINGSNGGNAIPGNAGSNPGGCSGAYNCDGTFCSGSYNCVAYTCTAWSCTTFATTSCNCQTCFPSYVRVIKSVAGTVTELTKWIVSSLGTSVVNSMRITTSGSQITIEPYANSDLTSKIGSDLVYTPTGVLITGSYGIIVEPSPTSQGYEIDEITIEKI